MATVNDIIEAKRSERNNPIMGFPLSSTHGVVMAFKEYRYGAGAIAGAEPKGVLRFPLPTQMHDSFNISISTPELGVLGGLAADAMTSVKGIDLASTTGLEQLSKIIGDAGTNAAAVLANQFNRDRISTEDAGASALYLAKAGATTISNVLGSGVGQGISAATGVAVNPHATLVFEGVNMKQYTMEWQLAPKNQREMNVISDMIKFVKRRMLPRYKGGGGASSVSRGLLSYPHLVELQYIGIDPTHIYTFKPSMIRSFDVDYSPQGKVMISGSGGQSVPAFINVSATFVEAQIWTAEDIK